MELSNFDFLVERAKSLNAPSRVAIAGGAAEHVVEATLKAKEDGIIYPIFVGDVTAIADIITGMQLRPEDFDIRECYKGMNEAETCVELVKTDKADCLMKGTLETSDFLRPIVKKENQLRTGKNMSHFLLLQTNEYHKLICITDGGVTPHPTFEQKADILSNAMEGYRKLGYDCPKAAILCCKETVDLKMSETTDADILVKMSKEGEFGECKVVGPISYDLAFNKESAKLKKFNSPHVGNFDILMVNDIHCGNILGKCYVTHLHARTGGIIMGCKVPIILSSRGSSTDEKYLSIVIAAVIAAAK